MPIIPRTLFVDLAMSSAMMLDGNDAHHQGSA